MTPIVNGLREEFIGELEVQQFDVDEPENAAVQAAYNLRGHPTIALVNEEGEQVQQFFGVVDEATLRQAILPLLEIPGG